MENETYSEQAIRNAETDLYAIDTAKLYMSELRLAMDPLYKNFKKCPIEEGRVLEHLIMKLIVENVEPTVDYSADMREYLKDKFNRFNQVTFKQPPFHFDFFVTAYNEPRSDENRSLYFAGSRYYYFYNCDQQVIVTRQNTSEEEFEILFVFALRQCDLMHVDQFLNYHLKENFSGQVEVFCKYVKQLSRKFSELLFTKTLTDSINDWIEENFKSEQKSEKIKTNMSVDQLAYLFKALLEGKLIDDSNKNSLIRVVCNSFESKVKGAIQIDTFDPRFHSPKDEAVEYWKSQFKKLITVAEKQLQKNLK